MSAAAALVTSANVSDTSTITENGHPAPTPPIIDMRSDTVTRPTPEMRKAMAEAEVGDDVYGDDPTVNRLQALAATLTGKEAALFVPSGTMGNLLSVLTHCKERGDEYIVGDQAHIHVYEQGGTASLGGCHPRVIPTLPDGTLPLPAILDAIRHMRDDHYPITRLICLENTHNRCGGQVLTKSYIDAVAEIAHTHNIQLHVDGARIFNAAVYLGVSVKDLLEHADSAGICLSKGLASPVGSLIVGTHDFIRAARRLRKACGGGMRQAGVLAAAGIISLTQMVDRLVNDHNNAATLSKGLAAIPGLSLYARVQTNIVFVTVASTFPLNVVQLKEYLKEKGILMGITAADRIRFVVHYQITSEDVQTVIDVMKQIALQEKKQ